MPYQPIESYGVIGDMHTVALVGTNGSIDWFCCLQQVQAFTHLALISAAFNLDRELGKGD